jgi:hypothetical protein
VLQGLLFMLGASTIPSLMLLLSRRSRHNQQNSQSSQGSTKSKCMAALFKALDICAFGGQLSMIVLWPLLAVFSEKYDKNLAWAIPLSLVCLSVRWWENFLEKPTRKKDSNDDNTTGPCRRMSCLKAAHKTLWVVACDIYASRIKIDLILSPWKILLTFGLMVGMIGLQLDDWGAVFSLDTR